MSLTISQPLIPQISWEKLPPDYPLPDDPVNNILQPLLATTLIESLDLASRLDSHCLLASNMGICANN